MYRILLFQHERNFVLSSSVVGKQYRYAFYCAATGVTFSHRPSPVSGPVPEHSARPTSDKSAKRPIRMTRRTSHFPPEISFIGLKTKIYLQSPQSPEIRMKHRCRLPPLSGNNVHQGKRKKATQKYTAGSVACTIASIPAQFLKRCPPLIRQ